MDKTGKSWQKIFGLFFNSLMKIVDIRIQHFKEHFTLNKNYKNPISRIKNKLTELAKEFVFVPADNAAYDIPTVWRKFYIEVLQKEITNSPTFQLIPFSENDICNKHKLLATALQAEPKNNESPNYVLSSEATQNTLQILQL